MRLAGFELEDVQMLWSAFVAQILRQIRVRAWPQAYSPALLRYRSAILQWAAWLSMQNPHAARDMLMPHHLTANHWVPALACARRAPAANSGNVHELVLSIGGIC